MTSPAENKKIVLSFLNEVMAGRAEQAFDTFCVPEYKQHNPRLVNGKAGLLEFARNAALCKGLTFNIRRSAAEDDLVWLQSELTGFHWADEPAPADPASLRYVVYDVFRVKDGKIVEHWDVLSRIPPYTANGNDMI